MQLQSIAMGKLPHISGIVQGNHSTTAAVVRILQANQPSSGKVRIIAAVTSLDTSVCDMETRRFNTEAAGLGEDVAILTISMDLPFAQKRWCGAAGVDQVTVLSDHRTAEFGNAYGVLIKENRLLARSVFVVDRTGVVRYVQIVDEVGHEPDYDAALKAARELV